MKEKRIKKWISQHKEALQIGACALTMIGGTAFLIWDITNGHPKLNGKDIMDGLMNIGPNKPSNIKLPEISDESYVWDDLVVMAGVPLSKMGEVGALLAEKLYLDLGDTLAGVTLDLPKKKIINCL